MCAELKNPFDALQILAQAAVHNERSSSHSDGAGPAVQPDQYGTQTLVQNAGVIEVYELVANGTLNFKGISELLQL
jgi:hypothetical protein